MDNSFRNLQLKINEIYRNYDKIISDILWDESPNYDSAIEHAIAMIPNLLFDIYNVIYPFEECEKKGVDYRKLFCFCINYSSSLYPNNRFHLHLDQEELKTFCFKQTDGKRDEDIKNFADCYDAESPLVSLLDLFYNHLGMVKNDFSMNRFFADKINYDKSYLQTRSSIIHKTNTKNQIIKTDWYWCIDEKNIGFLNKKQKKTIDLLRIFLQNETYGNASENDKHDYTNYAAFLAAAMLHFNNVTLNSKFKGYTAWEKGNPAFDSYSALYNGHSFRQYNIPIFGFQEDRSERTHSRKVIGNLMIPSLIKFNDSVLSVFYEKTDYFLNKITQYEKAIIAKRNAVRSAIAQVMARNLSHNYGSHVLNHLLKASLDTFILEKEPYHHHYYDATNSNTKEESLQKELYQQVIYLVQQLKDDVEALESIKDKNGKTTDHSAVIKQLKKAIKDFGKIQADELTNETLRQIVYLLSHLKCRVDYISDISFGAPTLQTSRNVYGDIFREFDRVGLLLNHISGLENQFHYTIVLRGPDKNDPEKLCELGKDNNDLLVAVPNDVVGTHAFYNILENVIRNTAKHSNTGNKEVTIHIDFSIIPKISEQSIADDKLRLKLDKYATKYYSVEIYDNVLMDEDKADKLVKKQNKTLNEPIFDNDGARRQSLGLIEMEASATYLRKRDSGVIDERKYDVEYNENYFNQTSKEYNLLKAFKKQDEESGQYYFGYRFFMLRPQEVLIVGNDIGTMHKPHEGVWTVNEKRFKGSLEKGTAFNHEFVIYEKEDIRQFIQQHKMAVSPRVLKMDLESWRSSTPSSETIINTCWKQWQEKESQHWSYSEIYGSYGDNPSDAIYLNHLSNDKGETDTYSFENAEYCEALSSNAQGKLPCFHHKDIPAYFSFLDNNETIKTKNLESINNSVLIVDERIQDAAYKQSVYGYPLMEHYKRMGVTVPEMPEHENEKDADINKFNLLEKDFSRVALKIKNYIDNNCKSFDFVLIHYGILERIFKIEANTSNNEWKKLLDNYLEELSQKGPRIILTSGRGVPGKLPSCVGFVSLSSVTAALIDYKSKYMLNCLMYAARKTAK